MGEEGGQMVSGADDAARSRVCALALSAAARRG